ncbi:hypothetical protein SAMN06265218_11359 [Fodinibius sediminis]|uniref:Uncharacterized protein n=1 Tax=Fodinibius sediminis TaxID=1214077 RepID=A0A521E6V1_9BACT|nr:hypothetical protein SAMN06265218_11359 [Fodinibius sediminis]
MVSPKLVKTRNRFQDSRHYQKPNGQVQYQRMETPQNDAKSETSCSMDHAHIFLRIFLPVIGRNAASTGPSYVC